jgi:hypothetical protein
MIAIDLASTVRRIENREFSMGSLPVSRASWRVAWRFPSQRRFAVPLFGCAGCAPFPSQPRNRINNQNEGINMDIDDVELLFVCLFFGMLLGVITGAIAQKKGEPFFLWWMFGTFLFIIALPLVIIMPAKSAGRNMGMKNCPYCGTSMNTSVMKCPNCKRSQPNIGAATLSSWEKTVTADDEIAKWAKQQKKDEG